MENSIKIMGTCMKCDTADSELFEYRSGYWICKANACYTEETERDSGRHIRLNQKLWDYRRLISRSNG